MDKTEEEFCNEGNEKRKRRSPNQAVRLSARGAFVLRELFKVRRMTTRQVARLCVVPEESQAAMDLCRRLRALGFITMEDLFHERSRIVVTLTDNGRRFAIDRLGRGHRSPLRDDGKDEFALHSIRGAELYVRVVSSGAKDWLAVRANADRFEWYSSNESVDIAWKEPGEFRNGVWRKVIPDALIETTDARFMLEVERSTKTLNGVMAKIENYSQMFSPVRAVNGVSPYYAKHADKRAPILVVLLDSAERAKNVKELLEARKQRQRYYVPATFIGDMEDTVAFLCRQMGLNAPPRRHDPQAQLMAEVRRYVDHIINRTGLSSLLWPANWKTVMRGVYPAAEWLRLEPTLDVRVAHARTREEANKNARGAA